MNTPNESQLILPISEIAQMGSKDLKPIPVNAGARLIPYSASALAAAGTFSYKDIKGEIVDNRLRYKNCRLNFWNRLLLPDGSSLNARGLSYFFSGIQWCAGAGWPIYSSRCPLSDTSPSMLVPDAKRHQLLVQFGGFIWNECSNSGAGVGREITDVFVGVNDDKFDDNTGTFEFIISSYSV